MGRLHAPYISSFKPWPYIFLHFGEGCQRWGGGKGSNKGREIGKSWACSHIKLRGNEISIVELTRILWLYHISKRHNKHCVTINIYSTVLNLHTFIALVITTKVEAMAEANEEKKATVWWCKTWLEHLDIYTYLTLWLASAMSCDNYIGGSSEFNISISHLYLDFCLP